MTGLKLKIVDLLERLVLPENVYAVFEDFFDLFKRRKPSDELSYHHKRILVIQPDLIGDVVLTSPFLRELRLNYPSSWITLVVEPTVLNLVEHCPHVNEILKYDCKNWKLYWRWKFFLSAMRLSLKHLIWRKFDLALFPHWDVDHYYATMLAYLSGATYRIGFSESANAEKRLVNRNYNLLLTHALEERFVKHEVDQKLLILEAVGVKPKDKHLELWLTNDDELFARKFLQQGRSSSYSLIAMCLGGSKPIKQWPLERFYEIAKWLMDAYDVEILLVGGKSNQEQSNRLKTMLGKNVIDSTGRTTLRQAAALLKYCWLYIGNDTGPMHLAAAARVPVIEISCHPINASPFRAYSPKRFGPWDVPHRVLQPAAAFDICALSGRVDESISQPFCDCCISDKPHCILGVSVEMVKAAVGDLMSELAIHV